MPRHFSRPFAPLSRAFAIKALVYCCWRCFRWALLLTVLGGVAAVPYLWGRIDDEIRQRVEDIFARHYQDFEVNVRFARLIEGQGIEIRDLKICKRQAGGAGAELAAIDELFLFCDTSLQQLATGHPVIRRFVVRRPRFRASLQPDGSWDAAALWPMPKFSDRPLVGAVEDATIEVVDDTRGENRTIVFHNVNLSIQRSLPEEGRPAPPDGTRVVLGSFQGGFAEAVDFRGHIAPDGGFQLSGDVADLELSPELRAALPALYAEKAEPLASVRAQAEFRFKVDYDPSAAPPVQFDLTGNITRGRVDDPRLPYLLLDLRAAVHCTHEGFDVTELTAQHGSTKIALECHQQGYDAAAPFALEGRVERLSLDRPLALCLPPNCRPVWPKFLPAGEVDARLKVVRQDGHWLPPEIGVTCRSVDFSYEHFPYRVEQAIGTLEYKDNVLAIDLAAMHGGKEIRVEGQITRPGPDFTGWVEINGREIPFDDKLFGALKEVPRRVVGSLRPHGTFKVRSVCWRDTPDEALHKTMRIEVADCSLRYEKFSYPIGDIRGLIVCDNGAWEFVNLTGANDTGKITCNGRLTAPDEGSVLTLHFTGLDVPLEEELRGALQPAMGEVWSALRPRGNVDLWADVRYEQAGRQLNVWTRIEPKGDTASIEPRFFPLRLEKLRGAVVYEDGHLDLLNLRAEHSRTVVATGGTCDIEGDGWRLDLTGLTVDRMRADRDLVAALPERLRSIVTELSPTGPINATGRLGFARESAAAPITADWDLTLDLHQTGLNAGVDLESVEGAVHLKGGYDGERASSRGELAIDSLMFRGFQFTDIGGPMWMDDRQILLGARVPPLLGDSPRRVTAGLYGGRVAADLLVLLGATPEYTFRADLVEGDLARAAQEAFAGEQDLRGKVFAQVELDGTGRGIHNLGGTGKMQLRDADIYELPVMVALLKVLNARAPDKTAFTTSDIDFHLEGGHIYFDQVNFNGDAVSLSGTGEMNLNREIRLEFHSLVGRRDLWLPVFRDLAGGFSKETVTIHVGGTLDEPVTQFEPFPSLNRAWQQLQADFQGPPSSSARPAQRPGRANLR